VGLERPIEDVQANKRKKVGSSAAVEESQRAIPAARGALLPGSLQGSLQVFPSELMFRVLSFLSAEDLTAVAPVCRHFRSAATSNMLWRRLFVARYSVQMVTPCIIMEPIKKGKLKCAQLYTLHCSLCLSY